MAYLFCLWNGTSEFGYTYMIPKSEWIHPEGTMNIYNQINILMTKSQTCYAKFRVLPKSE